MPQSVSSFIDRFFARKDGTSRPSEYLTLSYLWFVLLVLAGMGVARDVQFEEFRGFMLLGAGVSLLLALSLLAFPRLAMRSAPLIHVALCFAPLALPYTDSLRAVIFLSVFYTGLLLLPPVLAVWGWRTHVWVAAGTVVAESLRLWPIGSEVASLSMICLPLIAGSSVLFGSLTDSRRRGRSRSNSI